MTSPGALVNEAWNCAHLLRDDGVGYGDDVAQIASHPPVAAGRTGRTEKPAIRAGWAGTRAGRGGYGRVRAGVRGADLASTGVRKPRSAKAEVGL